MFDSSFVVADHEDPNIFTFLLHGCPATERPMYRLQDADTYRYMSKAKRNSNHCSISFDFVKVRSPGV
jgi:hypothetical protein